MNLYFLLFSEAYDPVSSVLKWLEAGIVRSSGSGSEVWLTYTLMINTFTFKQIKAYSPAKSRHISNIPSVLAISVSVQQRLRYEGNWRHWSQWDIRKRKQCPAPRRVSSCPVSLVCLTVSVWEPHRNLSNVCLCSAYEEENKSNRSSDDCVERKQCLVLFVNSWKLISQHFIQL